MENRKLISATDTQYSGTLLASLNEQRIHGLFCDVTVVVEDQNFSAHKNILSAASTYFHQLLSRAGQVVELSFVRAEMFAEILNYIYTSKIVRVRSDLLEELIKSGQLLGVQFIADLGVPLSQVKSLGSSSVKSNNPGASFSDSNQKVIDVEKTSSDQPSKYITNKDCDMDAVSVIPETTEISSNKFQESACLKEKGGSSDHVDDDDDDVIFCSEVIPPKPNVSKDTEMEQQKACPDVKLSSQQMTFNNTILHTQFFPKAKSPNNLLLKDFPSETNSSSVNIQRLSQIHSRGAFFGPAQKHSPNQVTLNSSNIDSLPPRHRSPTNNMLVKPVAPSDTFSSNPLIISDGTYASSTNFLPNSQIIQSNIEKTAAFDGPKLKNTQKSTFSQEKMSKTGELKIKSSGVTTGGKVAGSQHITDGKKIITLDTPSKIEELSTGCKVYENIGEDTFDIVIPIKSEADDDDDDGAVVLPRSIDGSPNSKRMKLKHNDHYEFNVDGKAYYTCIVCKRAYLSITTLRRHYNCHSWEKKYPCHYCEKVFPMAEYRTKHEILHTGERRYECLTCGDSFINYPITMSHIKSAHGKDPSGNGKLYRLHPSRTVAIRPYNYAADAHPSGSASPIIKDEMVYNDDSDDDKKEETASEGLEASNPISWDDVFVQEKSQVLSKPSLSEDRTEFEFVIPESY